MKKYLILLLMVSACTPQKLTKPGANEALLAMDKSACHYEALKATGSANSGDPIGSAFSEFDIENSCLEQKGWRWAPVQ